MKNDLRKANCRGRGWQRNLGSEERRRIWRSIRAADEDIGGDTNALRRVGVVLEEYCSSGGSCGRGGSGRENLHLELS